MTLALLILAGAFGGLIGSFLNVVVYRLPRGESLAFPASHCPACKAPVRPRDNVPVVSWLLLRGRCRDCDAPISIRYPALEALTSALFVIFVAVQGASLALLVSLPFVAALVALSAIDLERQILPDRILAPLAIWGVLAIAIVDLSDLSERLIAAAAAFAFFLVIALISPRGMGMGDVKFAGVLGLFLGLSVIPGVMIALLSGSLIGLAMMAAQGAGARKLGVPFGPFLAGGAMIALLAGPELIDLYVENFLS